MPQPIIRARDLMERDIITVTPETPLLDCHRLFVEEEIHGAPVVGEDLTVVGVVSTLDLLRVVREELEPGAGGMATTYFRDELPYSGPDWLAMPEDLQDRMQQLTVADAMTCDLVTVGPDATADELARMMLAHHIHRVLVLEDGVLRGVVSAFDLLRVLSRLGEVHPGPTRHTGFGR